MIRAGVAIVLVAGQSQGPPAGQPARPDAPPASVAAPQPPMMAPELAELDARIAAIADLRADFEQRKHTPLLKKPLVSRGTVVVRADRVRWDTLTPRRSSMLTRADEIRIHYPDDGIVEIYPVRGDLRELAGSPLPRLASLSERFDLRTIDPAAFGPSAAAGRHIAVELLPRTADLKEVIASVRVLFDARVPCVTHVVMTDPDGERTEIEFRNVRINAGVPESAMELHVPEGTREVRPLGAAPPERVR